MKKQSGIQWLSRLLVLMVVFSASAVDTQALSMASLNIDLKQLKNDSQVVQAVFDRGIKEGVKLLVSVKDLKPVLLNDKTETESYSGLGLSSESKAEGLGLLGAAVNQKHNLRLDYHWQSAKGGFFNSYSAIVDSLLGKDYVKKNLSPLMTAAETMKPGTEKLKTFGGQWQVDALYGKTAEGRQYLRLKLSTLFKSEAEALKAAVKNTEMSYEAVSATKHGIILKDKTKKNVVAKVYTDFSVGEMTISTRGDSGLSLFKQVANVGFKQVDPSGKTTFESVFSKELSLLTEYEKFAKNAKGYKLIDKAGQGKAIASENQLLKPLAEKFNLGPSLTTKEGVPAIEVKSGLIVGTLYFKDGFLNFSFGLWPLSK